MTTLTISTRENIALTFGRFGSNALSFTPVRASWERRTDWNGGYIDGYFRITGDTAISLFDRGLGYRVQEIGNGGQAWDGFIYEMIYRGTVDREKSYRKIYNSIAARAQNLIENSGFETGTAADWTLVAGGGTAAINSTVDDVAKGAYSLELSALATGTPRVTYAHQTIDCLASTGYRFTFYYKSTIATSAPRFGVETDSAVDSGIVVPTSTAGNAGNFRRSTVDFVTQSDATTMTVYLIAPEDSGATAFYDDVRIERVVNERPFAVVTPFAENAESIAQYGRKQQIMREQIPYYSLAITTRDAWLETYALPRVERGGLSRVTEPTLDVFVRGYFETLSFNQWTFDAGGAQMTIDDVFAEIVANNEFIDSYIINGTPPSVFVPEPYNATQADVVETMLTQIGDGYRVSIRNGRQLLLEENDYTPRYFMRKGLIYNTAAMATIGISAVDERTVLPAIARDLDSALAGVEPNSVYQDRRDFIMNRVEVAPGGLSFGASQG